MNRDKKMGVIIKGSLTEGIEMKLDASRNIEDIKAGKFVVIDGCKFKFFSMITDVRLETTSTEILMNPPQIEDTVLKEILKGTSTYAIVSLRPLLMLEKDGNNVRPVKTIPSHFSAVYEAQETDVNRIFGSEADGDRFFSIGEPLDMETPVCLDLDRFTERSNGIFGKTGTGKTFLARLIISGIIKNQKSAVFIFDMHNEYGWGSRKESGQGKGVFVKGLKQLFGNRVAIFSLDPVSTRRRGAEADYEVFLNYDHILVEDIAPLQEELKLNPTAIENAYLLVARYSSKWLQVLLEEGERDIKSLCDKTGANPESISALYRKLKRFERLPFLVKEKGATIDVVKKMMELLQRGVHVVLEFGQQNDMLTYLLVANIITRRLHELYVIQSEKYFAARNPADEPRQLFIVIEEAHKFLCPSAARQTIFGTIAREMRKYYVSLLIVDQRPSGIDDEILSQIGTKIVALLNDEKDIQAVFTGVSNSSGLRAVLCSLDSKEQALILGHAVPMPVVIRSRPYDEEFYKAMSVSYQQEEAALLFGR